MTGGRLQARFTIQNGEIDSGWLEPKYTKIRSEIYQDIMQTITDHITQLKVLQQGIYLTPQYSTFKDKVTPVLEFWQSILDVKVTNINDAFINEKSILANQIKDKLDKEILKQKQELTKEQKEYNRLLGILNKSKSTPKVVPDEKYNNQVLSKDQFQIMLASNSNKMIKPGPPTQTQEAQNMQQQIGKTEFFQKWAVVKTELPKIVSYNTAIVTLSNCTKVKVENMPEPLQKDLEKLIYKKDMKELFD